MNPVMTIRIWTLGAFVESQVPKEHFNELLDWLVSHRSMPEKSETIPDFSILKPIGKLKDHGDTSDGKRTFVIDDRADNGDLKTIRIEIDTDDCDSAHAKAFKKALIKLWNSQP